ncbi:MAG TPA: hypothetical protein ENI44_02760 [Thermoplasmatales archaeon]|nr:hypothetical protein [Thermoplasmatales archaeon]
MGRRYIDRKTQKKIARSRINKLFKMAEEKALKGDLKLANRYVEIARRISMRTLTRIPKKYKHRFCKHCYSYLLPGVTCRIRINRGKIVTYCYNCKRFIRRPFKS